MQHCQNVYGANQFKINKLSFKQVIMCTIRLTIIGMKLWNRQNIDLIYYNLLIGRPDFIRKSCP